MDSELLSLSDVPARVPEHSTAFMAAVSQGTPFERDGYVFYAAEDWLLAIGYPLRGRYSHAAFEAALASALQQSKARECWAIGPDLPPRLQGSVVDEDRFYVLGSRATAPPRLRGPLTKAAAVLRVEEGRDFTSEHRKLWTEFLERTRMKPNVRELFVSAPDVLNAPGTDLRLLNAWDQEGRLAACLLVDCAPEHFCSYLLGAHSRVHYTPHAADLLFARMLELARREGKRYVHLGLGVNEGILRFKLKWGAQPSHPYRMAHWEETPVAEICNDMLGAMLLSMGKPGLEPLRQADLEEMFPPQRTFGMLWEVEKNGKISWIGGTSHFFRYSFESSFRRLFKRVDTVIFEGPLDDDFMAEVDVAGKTLAPGQRPLYDMLAEEEIRRLERVVRGPEGPVYRWLNMEAPHKTDVRWFLRHAKPWCAMFSLWSGFLERLDWKQSVDLEAWRIALEMGKNIVDMETLEEQLAALDAVPVERVLRHFRACREWPRQVRRNVRTYLAGDLPGMMGSSTEFPTRTEQIIGARDQRFRERMRPYLEEGRCAVFVGCAHMINLRHMLAEDGFRVRRCLPSLGHKLRALCCREEDVTW